MRIGELAREAGVSTDTIRYYEREGLIGPARRASNGYRDYGVEALEDLVFIRKAQCIGLKLRDIREVMEISSGGRPPCEHVRATLSARLGEVERRLGELRALRATLKATLARLDLAPKPAAGCRCSVIEGA
ncbi:MAG: heavy metal-responsive transcriptional regulator [Gemmatimonadota bacterium]